MSETLMALNGRLYPMSIYREMKAAQDARQAAFNKQFVPHVADGSARRAFMETTQVDRVEIAPLEGKYKGDLTEARVNARVNGEISATMNRHGAAEIAVPASNLYGTPQITPIRHPFSGAGKE